VTIAAIVNGQTVRVDRVVNDQGQGWTVGPYAPKDGGWYYGYVENCFDPFRVLVFGENMSDAYDWLICDPSIEESCRVETDGYLIRDYSYGSECPAEIRAIHARWDARWIMGQGLVPPYDPHNPVDRAHMQRVIEYAGETGRLTWNDNGTMLDTESVQLVPCRPTIVLGEEARAL
jgi:hypothetical protein